IGSGQLTVGAVVSRTVTANEQVLVLCAASKAVQVTVVLPSAKVLPLAGEQVRSEEHTSELQSRRDIVCRLLLEKKKTTARARTPPPAVTSATQVLLRTIESGERATPAMSPRSRAGATFCWSTPTPSASSARGSC